MEFGQTPDIRLRELAEKDAPLMLEWMTDKDISKAFSFDADAVTLDTAQAFIKAAWSDRRSRHFAVVDADDTYLGTVSLKNIDETDKNAEYAISLRRCALGKGVAQAATRAVLGVAFDTLALERVYLYVETDNIRANKFYKKVGFIFEGTFRRHIVRHGAFKDINWYSALRDEYPFSQGTDH